MTKGKLLFIRHGESELNAKGIWTGQTDTGLTDKGRADAALMGEAIKDVPLHHAFTSGLKRTHQTLEHVLQGHGNTSLSRSQHAELNERDYGTLTGKDKWQVKDEIGEEAFNGIRRGWNYPVPGGETLQDVHDRAVPFYLAQILPRLQQDEHLVVVAHGNTIRALMKHIEGIHEDDIANVEMPFGTILLYEVDSHGLALNKEIRTVEVAPSKA
ncbi:MAG TPA: 2,3-bisphosphoglycerate-dependent phosphoglycerate mutase [Candidatus Saccharimonadales bacterium]|nr:2,3-bisphosphoglycerate-dependent phosphoglycerate mutase [Candidatus Saccharimonadales bacterium]